mgnify:CR=1 FL=1
MKLSRNTQLAIVVPASATKREEFASQELSKYLNKLFPGICIEIGADVKTNTTTIFIGGPERNSAVAAYISEADFDALVQNRYSESYLSDSRHCRPRSQFC